MPKPFPSRVNWVAFWKHRWVFLNLINQIAYGTKEDAQLVIRHYSGCDWVGTDLYNAAKETIKK